MNIDQLINSTSLDTGTAKALRTVLTDLQDQQAEVVQFDVSSHGAVGDGVTDDTVAINAAIQEAAGGLVTFGAGTFVYSPTVFTANANLIGEGMGRTTIQWKAGSAETNLFRWSGVYDVSFRNLTIDGNRQNQTDSTGYYGAVSMTGGNGARLTLDSVEFKNGRIYDVSVTGPTGAGEYMDLSIRNCRFADGLVGTATRAAQSVAVSEGVRVTFCDNQMLQPSMPAAYGRGGLVIQRPAGSTSLAWGSLIARGNYFKYVGRQTDNRLGCIYVYSGVESAVVEGNVAVDSVGIAYCVKSDSGSAIVSGNTVHRHHDAAVFAMSMFQTEDTYTSNIGRNFIVSNNTVYGAEYGGILVHGTRAGTSTKLSNVHVTGNIVDGGVRGIHLNETDTTRVDGNTIRGTTGAGLYLEALVGACAVINNTIQGGLVGITALGSLTTAVLNIKGNIIKELVGGNAVKLQTAPESFDIRDNYIDGCTGAIEIAGCSGNGYVIGNRLLNMTSYALSKTGSYGNLTWRDNPTSTGLGYTGMRGQTIAAGVITAIADWHQVDTEASASTDDLDTINGGYEGRMLTLFAGSSTRDVVVKDGTGNLRLNADMTLDHADDTLTLLYRGSAWYEIARSSNAT